MIDFFFDSTVRIMNSNFLLVLAMVYFWGSACMDVYCVSNMDERTQRMASLIYIIHFFFLIVISLFVLRHLP